MFDCLDGVLHDCRLLGAGSSIPAPAPADLRRAATVPLASAPVAGPAASAAEETQEDAAESEYRDDENSGRVSEDGEYVQEDECTAAYLVHQDSSSASQWGSKWSAYQSFRRVNYRRTDGKCQFATSSRGARSRRQQRRSTLVPPTAASSTAASYTAASASPPTDPRARATATADDD